MPAGPVNSSERIRGPDPTAPALSSDGAISVAARLATLRRAPEAVFANGSPWTASLLANGIANPLYWTGISGTISWLVCAGTAPHPSWSGPLSGYEHARRAPAWGPLPPWAFRFQKPRLPSDSCCCDFSDLGNAPDREPSSPVSLHEAMRSPFGPGQ